MATLENDTERLIEPVDSDNHHPVVASDIIYEGAAVGDNGSGYARPLVAGDPFRGFAVEKADNSDGAAGDINVRVRPRGVIKLAVTSVAITDVGKQVFASDDATFVLTQSTNTCIGHVHRFISAGVAMVKFDAASAVITELTAISGTEPPTETEHNLVITAVNALIRRLGA